MLLNPEDGGTKILRNEGN